jgi:hypothetical protein
MYVTGPIVGNPDDTRGHRRQSGVRAARGLPYPAPDALPHTYDRLPTVA